MNPILIDENNVLISGFRRLEACKKLGWKEIAVNVVALDGDKLKALELEVEENKGRVDLAPQDMEKYKEVKEELLTPPPQPNPVIAFFRKAWTTIKSFFASLVKKSGDKA